MLIYIASYETEDENELNLMIKMSSPVIANAMLHAAYFLSLIVNVLLFTVSNKGTISLAFIK